MRHVGKTSQPIKKTGKTIIAIDGPAHGLSSGKNLMFQPTRNS